MLQRAASNAYSWWLASHIRTKQSKWLEQNLQDMEEKVSSVLKLIEEDGDSFRKRAEMYYKKRPELIGFVQESFRAYRALAERYDHISTELQNANNTLASCFPDQVAIPMEDDDDDDPSPRFRRKPIEMPKPENIPKVPKGPVRDFKGIVNSATKKLQAQADKVAATPTIISGLSKEDGLAKIDKLQKRILALQTEKEFMKSSYESGLARYYEIDKEIGEVQRKVGRLQDEFGNGDVIEDDEARALMAAAALKSCHETLTQLQEKQERSAEETEVERKRIKDSWKKLREMKLKLLPNEKPSEDDNKSIEKEEEKSDKDKKKGEAQREKIKEHFEVEYSGESLDVVEMAEKIDELVSKVVSLETAISSQTALVLRLRTESDELQVQIQTLEDDKANLVDDRSALSKKLKEMEETLGTLEALNQNLEDQNNNLQTHFTEAQCNYEYLSEKLQDVKPDVLEAVESSTGSNSSQVEENIKAPADTIHAKEIDAQESSKRSSESPKKDIEVPAMVEVSGSSEREKEAEVDAGSAKDSEVKMEETKHEVNRSDSKKSLGVDTGSAKDLEVKMEETKHEVDISEATSADGKVHKRSKQSLGIDTGSAKDLEVKMEETKHEVDRSEATSADGKVHKRSKQSLGEMLLGEVDQKALSNETECSVNLESAAKENVDGDEPNWKLMFMNGTDERERTLLGEYTSVLRNFKDMKKKFTELEADKRNSIFEFTLQLKELKSSNAIKDEEIRSLRQKLSISQAALGENNCYESDSTDAPLAVPSEESVNEMMPDEKEVKMIFMEHQFQTISPIEEKFRSSIDELLEENLNYWMRFSTAFGQIQNFDTSVKDLFSEVSKLEERMKQEGSSHARYSVKSDVKPLYKHLREIQTELTVWLEKSVLLKKDCKNRLASLNSVQEDITKALKDSAEDEEFKFTSFQAAKFQGEVLNMKQENNKVADELQAGLDHVTTLQLEVERALAKLNEDFGLNEGKLRSGQLQHSESRSRVPLRSFIFGVKPKKQRSSLFSLVQPLNKKYNGLKMGK